MRIESGVTTRYIYFVAVDATDFATRETGLSSFTVYRSRNGGAASAMTTPTINETDATNMPGVYELLLDEDMTIDAGDDSQEMVFHITHAGMAPVTRTIELFRPKITAGYTLGVGSDGDLLEVNTLTGHTAQTGDSYARLGAPAGASISADIADVPTVSEFNARTLAAASYFDPATDTVANVTTVATVTNGVSIADSTSDAVIADAVWNAATATYGTVGSYGEHTEALDTSNLDATISSRAAASVCTEARLAELDAANLPADIDAVKADTNELQTDWANGGRLDLLLDQVITDIAALNNLSATQVATEIADALHTDTDGELSAIPAASSTLADKLNFLFMLARNKVTQTATTKTVYKDDKVTALGTYTVSSDGTTFTRDEGV